MPDLTPVPEPTDKEIIELPFAEKTAKIGGKTFKFRELSVQENDDCADAAKMPDGTINGRTMMRMMIINSSTEPKLTTKMLAAMPQRAYIRIYDVVNELNTLDIDVEDTEAEGNA